MSRTEEELLTARRIFEAAASRSNTRSARDEWAKAGLATLRWVTGDLEWQELVMFIVDDPLLVINGTGRPVRREDLDDDDDYEDDDYEPPEELDEDDYDGYYRRSGADDSPE